jgi:hypothetical protein
MFSTLKYFFSSLKSNTNIQPPVIAGNTLYNINDFPVSVFVEFQDSNMSWQPLSNGPVTANGNWNFINASYGIPYRAMCISTQGAALVSSWSNDYSYPNPDDVRPPMLAGNTLYNLNDFDVIAVVENDPNNLGTWSAVTSGPVTANSQWNFISGAPSIYRTRCFPTGAGTSVSSWSDNYSYPNTDNVQTPIVTGNTVYNLNNFEVIMVLEYWATGIWSSLSSGPVTANSQWTFVSGPPAPATYRARCFSKGSGTSASSWSEINADNLQPPVVSGARIYNINDVQVSAYIERYDPLYTANGTWNIEEAAVIQANGYHEITGLSISPGMLRARCTGVGSGRVSVSKYSDWTPSVFNPNVPEYPYSNQGILSPTVTYRADGGSGNVKVSNPNNFQVIAVLENSTNGVNFGDFTIGANSFVNPDITITTGGMTPDPAALPRARCFSTGSGAAVSAWSK